MAGALRESIDAGLVRPVPAEAAAIVLWAAWDGVIACHLLPDHMGLSDADFEAVFVLAHGLGGRWQHWSQNIPALGE